jgi:hypothetical protein
MTEEMTNFLFGLVAGLFSDAFVTELLGQLPGAFSEIKTIAGIATFFFVFLKILKHPAGPGQLL